MDHLDLAALEAGLDEIRRSPADVGSLQLIVRRPEVAVREILDEGVLSNEDGLVGDSWRMRGTPDPRAQLTLANIRAVSLVARDPDRRALAGDQLYVDFDLGGENAPPGTRLEIGSAVVEISDLPHRGCRKFLDRFGKDALRFVNSDVGVELNLRGVNAMVVVPGTVRLGDAVRRSV